MKEVLRGSIATVATKRYTEEHGDFYRFSVPLCVFLRSYRLESQLGIAAAEVAAAKIAARIGTRVGKAAPTTGVAVRIGT